MPGSGKGVVSEIAQSLGFLVVRMGDVIRDETTSRGLDPTPTNIGKIMLQLREEEGAAVVAERCVEKVGTVMTQLLLIDGIRSLDEVKVFSKKFTNFTLLAIFASLETRFARLFKRMRSDDGANHREFMERDSRELQVGIGSAMAIADYALINEGDLESFKMEVKRFLQKMIVDEWS
ncbi:MAG: flagellar hook-basal body complex protein FliE [Candidatus Bathyarchaeota archaeon]|nr:MAG: flagellar hook-basal body complex protein FliE [Candidatus Bathyarchaeota archaeon]